MEFDKDFWDKYADENESRNNEEFTKFITDLARSLHCSSVLEIGCGTGIDLRKFDDSFEIHGVDLNEHCLLYTSPSPRDVEESRMPSSA